MSTSIPMFGDGLCKLPGLHVRVGMIAPAIIEVRLAIGRHMLLTAQQAFWPERRLATVLQSKTQNSPSGRSSRGTGILLSAIEQ